MVEGREPGGWEVSMLYMIPGPAGFDEQRLLDLGFRETRDMMPLISASFHSVVEVRISVVALGSIFCFSSMCDLVSNNEEIRAMRSHCSSIPAIEAELERQPVCVWCHIVSHAETSTIK